MPVTTGPKGTGTVGRAHALGAQKRHALPSDAFAFPKARKEPLTDARHVRSAVRLFHRVRGVTDGQRDRAWRRICAAANRFGVQLEVANWHQLMKGKRRK